MQSILFIQWNFFYLFIGIVFIDLMQSNFVFIEYNIFLFFFQYNKLNTIIFYSFNAICFFM